MAKKDNKPKHVEIVNRKAEYEYSFQGEIEAGIMLTGTEVKSVRAGFANIKEAYCFLRKGELFIKGMNIAEYKFAAHNNHDPVRVRKLLLKKGELKKIARRVTEKGFTVVPYKLYISDRGFVKLLIALAQGKRQYDKRNTIKDRDSKRTLDRLKKIRL